MGNVQPPSGGLVGYSNYNLYSDCTNLIDVTVTIRVTEDMVAVPSASSSAGQQSNGIAFQLNCLPPTTSTATSWQQYILVVSRTGQDLRWGVNNWDNHTQDQLINQGGHLAYVPLAAGAGYPGYASIPAGYRFVIQLSTDKLQNVYQATYSGFDETGAPLFPPAPITLTSLKDVQNNPVTEADLAPIADIDFIIVGYANSADTTLVRGAGTITYQAKPPLTVLNTFPPCTAGVNTAESSNVTYGELGSAPSSQILQTFSASVTPAGAPAALYTPAAGNQQHVFFRGNDGGVYNVFYDPASNSRRGPELWIPRTSNVTAASDPAALYATAAGDQQHVFFRGNDGGIYNVFYEPADNSIHGPEVWVPGTSPASAAGDPAALYATAAGNQQHVFYRGTDGGIYNVFFDPSSNSRHGPEGWVNPGGAASDPAVLYATGAGNQQHVFYVGSDGGLYNVFYDPASNSVHGPERWA